MNPTMDLFEAMIAERTEKLPPEEATSERNRLLDNEALQNYYAQAGKLFVSIDGQVVDTLACERVVLEFPCQDSQDRSQRGQVNLARTRNGHIWAFMKGGSIFHSADGGRHWRWTQGSSHSGGCDFTFTILDDDTFLVVGTIDNRHAMEVRRSSDLGRTWQRTARIDPPAPYVVIGDDTPAMTQLSDGTILFATQCNEGEDWRHDRGHLVYRSTDAGRTWTAHEITCQIDGATPRAVRPGTCESQILELAGGRLLHTVRWNETDEGSVLGLADFHKTVCFLDSDDGGLTWKNPRATLDADGKPVLVYGQCHGQSVQLPDGRIFMVHDHRYPYPQEQTIGRVSTDAGVTWDRRTYHVSLGSGYPSILVLPDGTILTVTGAGHSNERGRPRASRRLWKLMAIRWKLPPAP